MLDAMLPYMTNQFGNPHSRTHAYGWESEAAVEKARMQMASLIGAEPKEIIFTSGATESNNIAVKGVARFYGEKKKHVITTQIVSRRFQNFYNINFQNSRGTTSLLIFLNNKKLHDKTERNQNQNKPYLT